MTFYSDLGETIGDVLEQFGNADALLVRPTPGAYNPATGISGTTTEATYAVKVLLDSSSLLTLGAKFGTDLVKAGDFQATLAANAAPITPAPGDVLRTGGQDLKVVGVQSSPSLVDAVVHTLLVRR